MTDRDNVAAAAEAAGDGWLPEVAEIRRRRELARAMGGPAKVQRQRATGRLTVRERIERLTASEEEAFAIIRAFLSYLPGSVHELPPVIPGGPDADPPGRRAESLAAAVPRNPRRPYRIRPILAAIFDEGSVLPYAEYGGGMVTALARLDGHPVGVLATDPYKGTTMQGGVETAFRAELEQADDPAAATERIRRELAAVSSPFRTAERFGSRT